MAALDLDSAYPCELLVSITKNYLREHVPASARRKAWEAFTAALDRARLDHGAGDDTMPWEPAPETREPASSITPDAVREVMQVMLAETVPSMADTGWQKTITARLGEIEEAELALFCDQTPQPGLCPECGTRPKAGPYTCGEKSCRMKRYHRGRKQREAAAQGASQGM
jgi:hypothetical protein